MTQVEPQTRTVQDEILAELKILNKRVGWFFAMYIVIPGALAIIYALILIARIPSGT